ncbi:MAG TPA: hypothetical protein VIM98_03775 [Dyella sp.]|uniref:hypothetical protein n=1 Tax=Dyella sp. TaxID=1869338 RepID=UPI002F9477D7
MQLKMQSSPICVGRRRLVFASVLCGMAPLQARATASSPASSDALAATGAGRLPYDLYLPSTMIGWSFDASTKFHFDEARGIYVLRSAQAGAFDPSDPRRFKISGADWAHQFGLGPNGSTPAQRATLQFVGSAASTTLNSYPDASDTLLPLDSDSVDGSEEVLLDFELKVLESALRPRLHLAIERR